MKYRIALIAIAATVAITKPMTQSERVLACMNGLRNIVMSPLRVVNSAIVQDKPLCVNQAEPDPFSTVVKGRNA